MRIFISPLDWGLGHAARCVPVIRYLLEKKIEVIIGAEGKHLIFLKEHFPDLEYIDFPGYRISYSGIFPVGIKVLLQLPKIVSAINHEHKLFNKIIEDKKIDAVISDNRYGLWNKKIPSIIITHQLNLHGRVLTASASKTTHNYINHFDECWIPDYEGGDNLSGALAHPIPKGVNAKYIGSLSRFSSKTEHLGKTEYDLLAILSGPEPQRTKLEELILKQLQNLPHIKTLIIQGLPGSKSKKSDLSNVEIVPHLLDNEFSKKVSCSNVILSRPGYSSIMDLNGLGWKKSIFIPTPGQTEQEYLGKRLEEKGLAVNYNQKEFSLKDALEKVKQINPILPKCGTDNYVDVIDIWLKTIL